MLLHSLLPWRVALPSAGQGSLRGGGRRRDVKLPLEILDLEPERQVLLAEIVPQELAEQRTKWRLVNDELQPLRVALLPVPLLVVVSVQLLRERDTTVNLGVTGRVGNFALLASIRRRTFLRNKIGRRAVWRITLLATAVPTGCADTFVCDLIDGLRRATEFTRLLKDEKRGQRGPMR